MFSVPMLSEASYTSLDARLLHQKIAGSSNNGGIVRSVHSLSEASYASFSSRDGVLAPRDDSMEDMAAGVQAHMEILRAERTRTVSLCVCVYSYICAYMEILIEG